jgi:predicted transcriptional regulator
LLPKQKRQQGCWRFQVWARYYPVNTVRWEPLFVKRKGEKPGVGAAAKWRRKNRNRRPWNRGLRTGPLQCSVMQCIILYYEGRIMSALKTISFRIPSDTVESLDELAEIMDRDRSHVLNEAVENYLRLNEHHIKLIQKGLRAAKEGKLVSHADVKKMISKMSRSK